MYLSTLGDEFGRKRGEKSCRLSVAFCQRPRTSFCFRCRQERITMVFPDLFYWLSPSGEAVMVIDKGHGNLRALPYQGPSTVEPGLDLHPGAPHNYRTLRSCPFLSSAVT